MKALFFPLLVAQMTLLAVAEDCRSFTRSFPPSLSEATLLRPDPVYMSRTHGQLRSLEENTLSRSRVTTRSGDTGAVNQRKESESLSCAALQICLVSIVLVLLWQCS